MVQLLDSGDCTQNHLKFFDGPSESSTLLGSAYCNSVRPPHFKTSSNVVFVKFKTDGTLDRPVFSGNYEKGVTPCAK